MSNDFALNPVPRAYRIAMVVIGVPALIAVFLDISGIWSFEGSGMLLLTPFFIMTALQMIVWPTSGNLSPKANRIFGATMLVIFALVALVSIIEFVSE